MIYVITTLKIDGDEIVRSRTVCFFHTLEEATTVLNENRGDLYEVGYYPHAIIEATPSGPYPFTDKRWFFEWDNEQEGYVKTM